MGNLQQTSKYRPDIDGLRAIAVTSVLIFHAFPKRFPAGFIGVDIFFVISGYLITGILLDQVGKGTFTYLDFYSRRIKRIFPALLMVLISTFLVGWYILLPDEFAQLSQHMAAGASFIANFALWRESGYFDLAADTKPLLHLWSLAVEEQFYIVWPILISIIFAKSKRHFFAVAASLWVISFAVSLWSTFSSPTAAFYSPWTRFWELGTGGLLAYLKTTESNVTEKYQDAQGWLGAALLVFGFVFVGKADPFPGWVALAPVFGAAFIISAGMKSSFCRFVLANRALVFVGLVSYPLYLWHWPLLILPKIAVGEALSPVVRLILLAVAFALAVFTYYVVEGRLRHSKSFKVPGTLASVMLALFFVGALFSFLGVSSRHKNADLNRILNAKLDWEYPAKSFKALGSVGHQFWFQNTDIKQKAIFIGDSNMEQYAPRISKLLTENPTKALSVVFATKGDCPITPTLFEAKRQCKDEMRRAFALSTDKDIATVVLGQLWTDYPELATDQQHQASLAGQIKALSAKKKVFVILNIPVGTQFDPKSMFSGSRFTTLVAKDPSLIKFDFKQFNKANAALFETVRRIAVENGAEVIDPLPMLCSDTECKVFDQKGDPLYMDEAHIRASHVEANILYVDKTVLSK
jgi:peptidoglycan/LPS O-acetylase OafA/YrhL